MESQNPFVKRSPGRKYKVQSVGNRSPTKGSSPPCFVPSRVSEVSRSETLPPTLRSDHFPETTTFAPQVITVGDVVCPGVSRRDGVRRVTPSGLHSVQGRRRTSTGRLRSESSPGLGQRPRLLWIIQRVFGTTEGRTNVELI